MPVPPAVPLRSARSTAVLLAAALALPAAALAQTPALLRDVHPGRAASLPWPSGGYVSAGPNTYFVSSGPTTGAELWRTDGTSAGTALVKDVVPGPGSASPEALTAVGNTLFFMALGHGGEDLWRTDGTEAGTVRLVARNAPVTLGSSVPAAPVSSGGRLFFVGEGGALWKSDGTLAGTGPVMNFTTNSLYPVYPIRMADVDGTLFLLLNSKKLWKSDGTEAGTVLVSDLDADLRYQYYLQDLGGWGRTAFLLSHNGTATQLRMSDGSSAGTRLVTTLPGTSWSTHVAGSRLYLSTNKELWTCDGTAEGTRLVRAFGSLTSVRPLSDGTLHLAATDVGSTSPRLWTSDGTQAGTVVMSEVAVAPTSGMVGLGATTYFTSAGPSVWRADGSATGTVQVKLLPSSLRLPFLAAAGGQLYFRGESLSGGPPQQWRSDGTEAGTVQLVSAREEPLGSQPGGWASLGNLAFFPADDGAAGREPWRTDGTPGGTALATDLAPGAPSGLTTWGTAEVRPGDPRFLLTGSALWRSTPAGTGFELVRTFEGASPASLVRVDDAVYFAASAANDAGRELWKSDGTAAGTVRVHDICAGTCSSFPRALQALGGALYFIANDATSGQELWRSDGTAAGTRLVKDVQPGSAGGLEATQSLARLNGTLYFYALSGGELWKSDGTEAGTVRVATIPGPYGVDPRQVQAVGNRLYLYAPRQRLWTSDGTEAGTVALDTVAAGSLRTGNGRAFQAARAGAVFAAWTAAEGTELWVTDGTAAGTRLVKDLWPGPDSSLRTGRWGGGAVELFALEDRGLVVFAASDGTSGEEPWVTDGTPEGTLPLADLVPGPVGSAPADFARLGERLLFGATDPATGHEPHTLPLPVWTDRSPPRLTCPAAPPAQWAADGVSVAVTYPPATATDLSGAPTLEYSHPSGSAFPKGTTTVTVQATDALGLKSTCTFDVKVSGPVGAAPAPAASGGDSGGGCASGAGPSAAAWGLLALLGLATRRRRAQR